MYDQLDRSAVRALRRRGLSHEKIAEQLGCDRKTVQRILATPVDQPYQRTGPGSQADPFKSQIVEWLGRKVPVKRMLELARAATPAYAGSRSAFFARVKQFREEKDREGGDRFVRFEGLPGEYAQVDWGEVRNFPFTREQGCTRYFLAVRLKYSRLSYVEFTTNMVLETLIRCLLRAFEAFGGVPWVCVFDNMKTVTTGRDEHGRPIWNVTFFKFITELDCHPEACWRQSGNQKGAVENLVGWVKSSFLQERCFLDDADLACQNQQWLDCSNTTKSQAHGRVPLEVHEVEEKPKLTPLMTTASDYGLFRPVKAGPECLVHIDSNRYSIPDPYAQVALTARIRERVIDFYDGAEQVAHYKRSLQRLCHPIMQPEHFERVFQKKPRARVMVYRDHLIQQDSCIAAYIATLCHRFRGTFGPHILQMYELLHTYGVEQLGVACALASEHEAYGSDYLAGLLKAPRPVAFLEELKLGEVPPQEAVDRDLAAYEAYVERTGSANGQ